MIIFEDAFNLPVTRVFLQIEIVLVLNPPQSRSINSFSISNTSKLLRAAFARHFVLFINSKQFNTHTKFVISLYVEELLLNIKRRTGSIILYFICQANV